MKNMERTFEEFIAEAAAVDFLEGLLLARRPGN
jgi:hypothetical protein